jgi:hypothetical protein
LVSLPCVLICRQFRPARYLCSPEWFACDFRHYSLKRVSHRQRNQDVRSGVLSQFHTKVIYLSTHHHHKPLMKQSRKLVFYEWWSVEPELRVLVDAASDILSRSSARGDRSRHLEGVFRRGLCGRSSQPEMEFFIGSSTLSQQYGTREISLLHWRYSAQSAERASLTQKTVHWWRPREAGALVGLLTV